MCTYNVALRSHILHTCPRNLARAPQKLRTDHGVSDLVCFTQLSLSEMMHGEVSGLVCFTQLPLSKRVLDPGVGSFEATSSRGDWRKEMEAEQRESAASATAIADAEDIESQRYRPCCERPDDSMSCIAHPASNRCRVVTKSTRLAENATLLASLGGQARCAAAVCAYFVNGYRPTVESTTTLRAG